MKLLLECEVESITPSSSSWIHSADQDTTGAPILHSKIARPSLCLKLCYRVGSGAGAQPPSEICGLLLLPMLVLTCSWILVVHVQGAIAPADVAYEEAPTIFSRKCFEAHAIGEFLQHR